MAHPASPFAAAPASASKGGALRSSPFILTPEKVLGPHAVKERFVQALKSFGSDRPVAAYDE
eukprot:8710017-Alexandrium_andersonii.AAC.1